MLLRSLYTMGFDAYLWIPEHLKDNLLRRFHEFFKFFGRPRLLSRKEEIAEKTIGFIILDRFKTPAADFTFWSSIAPLIGIDEGGPCRNRFDFLVDLLPVLAESPPNLSAPGLLPLPRNRRPAAANFCDPPRVLISFGAEDSAGLGFAAACSLSHAVKHGGAFPPSITLIAPVPPHDPSGKQEELPGVRVMGRIPHLMEQFSEYDLMITHFGLGAFEAVYARLPVLLVSPTAYHEKLSRNAGFFSLGTGVRAAARLGKLKLDRKFLASLSLRCGKIAGRFGLEADQKKDISSFAAGLSIHSPGNCPACSADEGRKRKSALPVIARFTEESYRRCPACGMIYLSRLKPPPVEYEKDYFFDSYKIQYGKTYLEDFPNLLEMARRRLANITALCGTKAQNLLDIGCAYGPFLTAAAEAGFSPAGIEPAEDAVRYVKTELGFPCRQGFFPAVLPELGGGQGRFDVVTLWYVIEHFQEPGNALREIRCLLKDGGVLAFSTPSFSGISGRKSLRLFLKNSPPDHWTIWSPKTCKRIFRQYGFRLLKIAVTGHHPERFPLVGRFVRPAKNGLLYRLLLLVSRLFRLGDTFEAYGVKCAILIVF